MRTLAVNFAAAAMLGGMVSIRRSDDALRKQKAAIFAPAAKAAASVAAGDFVSFLTTDGGTTQGMLANTLTAGRAQGDGFDIEATELDPAALVTIYEDNGDGYTPTDKTVGVKVAALTKIEPLPGKAQKTQKQERMVRAMKFDDEKQIVYGMVYAPDTLDTYGEYMKAEDIELMAHRYLKTVKLDASIDVKHDNVARDAYPVESFIARKGDPDYPEGAWVLGVKVEDATVWTSIKKGELNGFSYQAMVAPVEETVTYDVVRDHVGPVCKAEGFDHDHVMFVQLGDDGKVLSGRTSKAADGHFHEIARASVTEAADGHTHRYFL